MFGKIKDENRAKPILVKFSCLMENMIFDIANMILVSTYKMLVLFITCDKIARRGINIQRSRHDSTIFTVGMVKPG